jgi:hypothetical protein
MKTVKFLVLSLLLLALSGCLAHGGYHYRGDDDGHYYYGGYYSSGYYSSHYLRPYYDHRGHHIGNHAAPRHSHGGRGHKVIRPGGGGKKGGGGGRGHSMKFRRR